MKNKIVKGYSTLGGKSGGKKPHKRNDGSKIMNARDNMERSEYTGLLRVFMIIIPFAIVAVILVVLFFCVREFQLMTADSQNNSVVPPVSEPVSVLSDEERAKQLVVASKDSPLSDEYKVNIVKENGISYDEMIKESLNELLEASKAEGLSLKTDGAYISKQEQDKLFEDKVTQLMQEQDYSRVKAENEAEKIVPRGGCSDRQTGLSVVFSSGKNKNFEESDEYKWLERYSIDYGFVLRYSKGAEETTGVSYNPALFRYVGKENAAKMRTLGLCLEDYADYVNSR